MDCQYCGGFVEYMNEKDGYDYYQCVSCNAWFKFSANTLIGVIK